MLQYAVDNANLGLQVGNGLEVKQKRLCTSSFFIKDVINIEKEDRFEFVVDFLL